MRLPRILTTRPDTVATRAATRLTAALLGAALILTGCSDDHAEKASGKAFNDADVAFATDMVQHHAQALQMVDLTLGRPLDPEAQRLAEGIRDAQTPEIEKMTDWLQAWEKPVPETVRDHANAHGDGSALEQAEDMPGMMSAEQMHELETASDKEFQDMWLTMMVEHHEGAVQMAEEAVENGQNAKVVAMAEGVVSTQEREIATMKEMLAR